MNKQESMALSARIGRIIAERAPTVKYTSKDIERARAEYSEEELAEMREIGLLGDDFETFYVIREFYARLGLSDEVGGGYILKLFENAKKLDAIAFRENPYIKGVNIPVVRSGNILLTRAEYGRGEIFLYDMPDVGGDTVVQKLGFFDRRVSFPTLYEGNIPWMSICPSEINSMKNEIEAAHGNVLVLGLGLGYYPFMIAQKPEVKSITVVELQQTIIDIVGAHLVPQFPNNEKIKIVKADAIEFLESVSDGEYDFCFADIWEGALDGAEAYKKIKPHEKRLPSTTFTYWIEEQIRAFLEE